MSYNENVKYTIESIDEFDNWFLKSKDLALQPINFLFESECKKERQKTKHLSIKVEKNYVREFKSSDSKKSKKSKISSQKSDNTRKSQKSTSNTNKKPNRKKGRNSIYNSNVVIVHYEDDDCSSTDPIQKEVEKLNKLLTKKKFSKKKSRKSNKSDKSDMDNINK